MKDRDQKEISRNRGRGSQFSSRLPFLYSGIHNSRLPYFTVYKEKKSVAIISSRYAARGMYDTHV